MLGSWAATVTSATDGGVLGIEPSTNLPARAWKPDTLLIPAQDPVAVTLTGVPFPRTGAVLTRRLGQAVPLGQSAALAYWDAKMRIWVPVQSVLGADRVTVTARVEHFSIWDVVYYVLGKTLTKRVDAPQCAGAAPSWVESSIFLDDPNAPLRWCVGRDPLHPDLLVVKVRNNRAYGVAISPATNPSWVWSSFANDAGLKDVLQAGVSGVVALPEGLSGILTGALFLPPGMEADFGFSENEVQSIGSAALLSARTDVSYLLGGVLFDAISEAVNDKNAAGTAVFLLIDLAQCIHEATSGNLIDRALALLRCAADHAEGARNRFIDLAARNPQLSANTLRIRAVLIERVLLELAAAQVGAQVGELLFDTTLVAAAREIHVYPASAGWDGRHLIITSRGLGSVRVGMSIAAAKVAAGVPLLSLREPGYCESDLYHYGGGHPTYFGMESDNSKTISVVAAVGNDISGGTSVTTLEGVGLGSSLQALQAAYPTLTPGTGYVGNNRQDNYVATDRLGGTLWFTMDAHPGTYVVGISAGSDTPAHWCG